MISPISTGSATIKSPTEKLTNQRPRKRDCNVLKFHNFVPNKELSCFSRVRGSSENILTGHCLKEENGSKQINVCNWQKKQQQSTPSTSSTIKSDKNDSNQQSIQLLSKENPIVSNDISTTSTINSDDLTTQSILGSLLARNEINNIDNQSNHHNHDDDLINGYTVINVGGNCDNSASSITINGNYGFLMPTTTTTTTTTTAKTTTTTTVKTSNKTNRRKPSTVRRFLRSSENTSNDDDDDGDDIDAEDDNDDEDDYNGAICNHDEYYNNEDEPLDLSTARKRPFIARKGEMKTTIKNDQFNQLIDYLPVLIPGAQITTQQLPQTMIAPFLPYLLNDQQQSIATPSTSVNSSSKPTTSPSTTTTGIDSVILLKQNKLLLPHLPSEHLNNNNNHHHQPKHRIPIKASADLPNSSPSSSSSSSSISSIASSLNHRHLHHSSRGSTIPGIGHFKVSNKNLPSTTKALPSSNNHHHLNHHLNRNNSNNNQNLPTNERNTIKAKLENEFRTNGFLVKTKEVSDGEATFCKFRQLRKYTRYYLKSWHQHLPDEINKLWKGFLPPKTSKPSSSSSSSPSSSTSSSLSTPQSTINLITNPQLDQTRSHQLLNKQMTLNGQPMDIITSPTYQPF